MTTSSQTTTTIPACPAWCEEPAGHEFDALTTDMGEWARIHSRTVGAVDYVAVMVVRDERSGQPLDPAFIMVDDGVRPGHLNADDGRRLAGLLVETADLLEGITGARS